MASLFRSGFELNNAGTIEWTTIIGTPTVVAAPFPVTSGSFVGRIANLVSGTRSVFSYQFAAADGDGPIYARGDFRYSSGSLPTATNTIMMLTQTTGTIMARLTLESSGSIVLRDEDGAIGSSAPLTADQVYRLEMEFNRNGGVNSVVRARIDGTEFAGSATRAISAGIALFRVAGNGNAEAQTVGEWFWDNLAVNDSTGSFQNSYPGAGQILHLRPNATGDNDAWTGTWADIDEITPNDATDDINSNTLDQLEDVNVDNAPADIGASDTINLVSVGVRFRISSATGADPTFVVRIKASSGGTVEESSTISPVATTWLTNAVAVPKNYPLVLYDLPGASTTAWTKADLDTAQIGVHETLTDAHTVDVTAMWLLVDYTPAGGPQTFPQAVAGTLSFSSGTLLKSTNHLLSADLPFVGDTLKQTLKGVAGSLSFSGVVATTKLFIKAVAGTLSFASGLLTKQVGKQVTGNLPSAGNLIKSISHKLVGSLSFTGNLIKSILLASKTGSLSFLGALSRLPNKSLSGRLFLGGSGADNFNRADSTNLGPNWTEDFGDAQIVSQRLRAVDTTTINWNKIRWVATPALVTDVSVQASVFLGDIFQDYGVGARMVNAAGEENIAGYALWVGRLDTEALRLNRILSSGSSIKLGNGTSGFGAGETHIIRFDCIGNHLLGYFDGNLELDVVDNTFQSGGVGVYISDASGSAVPASIDNWQANYDVGVLSLKTFTGLAGVLSFSGQLLKNIAHKLSAGLTFTGILQTTKVFLKAVGGTLSFASGLLTRRTGKNLGAGLTFTGGLVRRSSHGLAGSLSFSGLLLKQTFARRAGTLSFSGSLSRRIFHALLGTLSFSGTLLRSISHQTAGNLSFSGNLVRRVGKFLIGALSFVGDLVTQKLTNVFHQAVEGTLTFAGTLRRSTSSRGLIGTLTFSGSLLRSIAHRMTGSLSFSGALAALRIILKAVGGVLSFSGVLLRLPRKSLTGTLTTSGSLRKAISRSLGGALSFIGNLVPLFQPHIFISAIGTVSTASLAESPQSSVSLAESVTATWNFSDQTTTTVEFE